MKSKSGERTLLASVLLSSPGPLVVAIALFFGRSSTQLADFIRRTAELVAIVVSLIVYRKVLHGKSADMAQRKHKLERVADLSVGLAMCLSGAAIVAISVLSNEADKGNVIPGLVIAVLGVITNTWFWFRYARLDRETPNAVLAVQSHLYRAKSLVDACVVIALTTVAIAPAAPATRYVDLIGSLIVSIYLMVGGVNIVRGKRELSGELAGELASVPATEDTPQMVPGATGPSQAVEGG